MQKVTKPPQRIYVELDHEEIEALDRLRSASLRTRPMELKYLLAQATTGKQAATVGGDQ